ncbi:hypothetical protein LINPERPRIM_LOCUS1527 [Linum perenne]
MTWDSQLIPSSSALDKIQKSASQDQGLDLNKPEYKAYVRHVVNKFLQEAAEEEDEKEEAEEEAGVKDNKLEGWSATMEGISSFAGLFLMLGA